MSREDDVLGARPPGAREYVLLGAISLTWGSSYMFTKIAVGPIPPLTLISVRLAIASVVMIVISALRGGIRLTARDALSFMLVGLMANAAPLTLIAISVFYVHSSVTATTMALVPLITTLIAALSGARPGLRDLLGILVGLCGIAVLFGPDAFTSFGDSARGALAAIGAALVFSISLFVRNLVRHHSPVNIATASLVCAAIWAIPLALYVEGVPDYLPTLGVGLATLVLAVLNTAIASLLLFALLSSSTATFAAYNNYLVPAVAVAFGSVFLGEPFTFQSFAGVALVLCGVGIGTVRRKS